MNLDNVRKYLSSFEFRPHTATSGGMSGGIDDVASLMARAVLTFDGDWGLVSDHLGGTAWDNEKLDFYKSLDENDRLQVLGLAGAYAHETTHKIDYLVTPFGVRFYGTSCLEYLEFQDFGEKKLELLANSSMTAMRDLPRSSTSDTVPHGPDALLARVKYFDSLLGTSRRYIKPGWNGNTKAIQILGSDLEKLVIHDVVITAGPPGDRSNYLRPLAILEGRAMAITLSSLRSRLGRGSFASEEVARYLHCFYNPKSVTSDYLLLLDLYCSMWSPGAHLQDLVESFGPTWLANALDLMNLACWYSLHAPPIMTRNLSDNLAYQSPMIRILNALHAFGNATVNDLEFDNDEAALNYIDQFLEDEGTHGAILPIDHVLQYCLSYLETIQKKNLKENRNAAIRDHFENIFTIQIAHFRRRIGVGYAYPPGIPSDGDYLKVLSDTDMDLLPDSYVACQEVREFYTLRQNLFLAMLDLPEHGTTFEHTPTPAERRAKIDSIRGTGHLARVERRRNVSGARRKCVSG